MPLAAVIERVRAEAAGESVELGEGELVGLAPAAAFEGFPDDLPLRGFDERRHILERRIG
jgi:hypothetical protein